MKYRLIFLMTGLFLIFQSAASAVTVRDVVITTKGLGSVVFSHGNHINKKGLANNCRACHDTIFDLKRKKHFSMAEMEKGKSCGACHEGKKAFSLKECARCHLTPEIRFKVKATGPTRFSHLLHRAASPDCGECHPSLFAAGRNKRVTMTEMEKGKSCGACHNSKKAFSVKDCSKCHPVRELVFEEKTTGNVVFSHTSHISLYRCTDCHTSLFPTTRSKAKVSMQAMEKGGSCGKCHEGKTAFGVQDKCELCHKM